MKKIIFSSVFVLFMVLHGLNMMLTVYDENRIPVEDVIVRTDERIYRSNNQGRMLISEDDANTNVVIHKIGYQDQQFSLSALPAEIYLRIKPIRITGEIINEELETGDLSHITNRIYLEMPEINYSIPDLIYNNTGLNIQGSTLTGERVVLTKPGFEGRHTLVLLDGIPLNTLGQSFDLSSIPADIISSIEILDPGSSEAGSGAMGVIINLKTRDREEFRKLKLSQSFGSFGLNSSSVNLSGYWKNQHFFASMSRSYTRNDFKYEAKEYWDNPDSLRTRKYNDKKNWDILFNTTGRFQNFILKYQFLYQDFFKKLPGPTNNPDLYKNSRLKRESIRHQFSFERYLNQWLWKSQIYYFDTYSTYDNTLIEEPWSNFDIYYLHNKQTTRQSGLKLSGENTKINPEIRLGTFYNKEYFTYEDLRDNENLLNKIRENMAVFVDLTLNKEIHDFEIKLNAGSRLEKVSDFNWFQTWNINPEIKFRNLINVTLGVSTGEGLTVPSIYDLYWQGDTQTLGNPDLTPETVQTVLGYLKLNYARNTVKFSMRSDDIENKILWIPDYNKTWKPINVGAVQVDNFEIHLQTNPFKFLAFDIIYSKIKAIDKSRTLAGEPTDYYSKELIYNPGKIMRSQLKLNLLNFEISTIYKYTGCQWTTRDQLSDDKKLSDYSLLDTNINYRADLDLINIILQIELKNITNTRYEIYEYSPAPGFNWEFSLSTDIDF